MVKKEIMTSVVATDVGKWVVVVKEKNPLYRDFMPFALS